MQTDSHINLRVMGMNAAVNNSPTVFVIDNDRGSLRSLSWMLRQADLSVQSFSTGREFLAAYQAGQSGCLVLDVSMPAMDGLALRQTLRKRLIHLPIIFLTAYRDVPEVARAFRESKTPVLDKPVDDKVLLEHIGRLIAQDAQIGSDNVAIDVTP